MTTTTNSSLMGEGDVRAGTSRFLSQTSFCVYKGTLMLYFVFWSVFFPVAKPGRFALKFYTSWTFYAATAYFIVSTITACLCWRAIQNGGEAAKEDNNSSISAEPSGDASLVPPGPKIAVPRRLRTVQLVLWNISCIASLGVALIYWGALHGTDPVDSIDVNAHGAVGLIMLIDQLLVAADFKLRHMVIAGIWGLIYVIFNVTWYYRAPSTTRLIYPIFDWDHDTVKAVAYSLASLLILTPLIAFLHAGICRLRETIYANRTAYKLEKSVSSVPSYPAHCEEGKVEVRRAFRSTNSMDVALRHNPRR